MARQITAKGPVLELGPGTGAITAEILAHGVTDLTCVEFDGEFARHLRDPLSRREGGRRRCLRPGKNRCTRRT